MTSTEFHEVLDGDRIPPEEILAALTRAGFAYGDGATQVFTADGRTTYVEPSAPSQGEWGVDSDGRFWSFWPPSYRALYDLTWIADTNGRAVGVRFDDVRRGDASEGRYVFAEEGRR